MYKIYAPKESSNENGFIFYYDHGLTFSAYAMNYSSNESMVEVLQTSVEFKVKDWTDEDSEYIDMNVSEVLENKEDRYQIITAKKQDLNGTSYEVIHIYYMDVQENNDGVLWDLQLSEIDMDSETALIIDELAGCYDVDLDVMKMDSEWAAANDERLRKEEAANSLPETVLWFNATYAPLTYSNNCDWEIEDKASAMETIENLKKNGHRAKCRECMEELGKLGILDEKDEEKFAQALLDSGIKENLYRYVFAYDLHRNGLDEDYIAAWDLCRVNQLYADFYICGYMTYEEAMDASLENSVILQKMYPSWKEMVTSYLAGYQFWQSDPMLTDDSPTLQRYQCYLDLLELENGPYTLDWNMKLEKSW